MTSLADVIDEVIANFKDATFPSGAYVDIDIDNWDAILSTELGSPHSLSATDLESAQTETDAWLLSNGHKRISAWYNGATRAVVAL